MASKKLITLIVLLEDEGTLITVPTKQNKPVSKRLLTVVTPDEQKLFVEVRGKVLERMQELNVSFGDIIEIGIYFSGSSKKDHKFNNICCVSFRPAHSLPSMASCSRSATPSLSTYATRVICS